MAALGFGFDLQKQGKTKRLMVIEWDIYGYVTNIVFFFPGVSENG
jgi:hypothetical protein